jgi:hypothetical protein
MLAIFEAGDVPMEEALLLQRPPLLQFNNPAAVGEKQDPLNQITGFINDQCMIRVKLGHKVNSEHHGFRKWFFRTNIAHLEVVFEKLNTVAQVEASQSPLNTVMRQNGSPKKRPTTPATEIVGRSKPPTSTQHEVGGQGNGRDASGSGNGTLDQAPPC